MKSILTITLLTFNMFAFNATFAEELEVTAISADEGKDFATVGIECASYFTFTAAMLEKYETAEAPSVIELAKTDMLNNATLAYGIAKAFTLNSEEHLLSAKLETETTRVMELFTTDLQAAEAELVERSDSCPAFLDAF